MLTRFGSHVGCFVVGAIAAALACLPPASAHETASPRELMPTIVDTGLYSVKREAFSHDGRRVAFLGYLRPHSLQALAVTVFDVRSRRLIKALPISNSVGVTILKGGIAFSPDDARLAAGAKEIIIWDTQTWTEATRAPGPFADGPFGADDLLGLDYSPDGRRIVAAYGKVWGPGDVHVTSREKYVGLAAAARLAYRNGNLPNVYRRPEIELLDASTGARLKRFTVARNGQRGDRSLITSELVVSQDGRAAYVAVQDRGGPGTEFPPRTAVDRVDLESGQVREIFERPQEDYFSALGVSMDQSLFATGELVGNKHSYRRPDGTWVNHETTDPVRIWSAKDGGLRADLGPPVAAVRQLLFLPDNSAVLACQTDNRSHNLLALWDRKTKSLTAVVHVETPRPAVVTCALSADGRQAVLTVPTGDAFGTSAEDRAYLVDVTALAK